MLLTHAYSTLMLTHASSLMLTQSHASSLLKSASKSFVRSHPKLMLLARRCMWKCAAVLLLLVSSSRKKRRSRHGPRGGQAVGSGYGRGDMPATRFAVAEPIVCRKRRCGNDICQVQ